MKIFNREISISVAIGTIVVLLIAAKIGISAYQHYFPNQDGQGSTTAISETEGEKNKIIDWKTYKNEGHGFQFEYPANLIEALEEPMEESICEIASDSDSPCEIFSDSGLFIAIIKHKFDEKIVWSKGAVKKKNSDSDGESSKTITVDGRKGYEYNYITSVNYKIHGIQTPLDTDHF